MRRIVTSASPSSSAIRSAVRTISARDSPRLRGSGRAQIGGFGSLDISYSVPLSYAVR